MNLTTNTRHPRTRVGADAMELLPERFGLVIGRVMDRSGVPELLVTKGGVEVGTLMLTTAIYMGVTITVVGWERLVGHEIQQFIYDCDKHDQPLSSGVFGSWDREGLARLDAHRLEIIESLVATVATARGSK